MADVPPFVTQTLEGPATTHVLQEGYVRFPKWVRQEAVASLQHTRSGLSDCYLAEVAQDPDADGGWYWGKPARAWMPTR